MDLRERQQRWSSWIELRAHVMEAIKNSSLVSLDSRIGIHVLSNELLYMPGKPDVKFCHGDKYPVEIQKTYMGETFFALLTTEGYEQYQHQEAARDLFISDEDKALLKELEQAEAGGSGKTPPSGGEIISGPAKVRIGGLVDIFAPGVEYE